MINFGILHFLCELFTREAVVRLHVVSIEIYMMFAYYTFCEHIMFTGGVVVRLHVIATILINNTILIKHYTFL